MKAIEWLDVIRTAYQEFDIYPKGTIAQLEAELAKWRNWKPDDENLADMQQQALARDGTYTNGLAAGHVYMRGLEARQRELETENRQLRRIIEVNAPDVDIEYNLDALKYGLINWRKPVEGVE